MAPKRLAYGALHHGDPMFYDGDRNGTPDYFVPHTYAVDTQPPPLPTDFKAEPAESAVLVSWTPPNDVSDVWFYQALCAGPDGQPAKPAPTCTSPDDTTANCPRYVRSKDLCGIEQVVLVATDISGDDTVDAGVASVPMDMLSVDPKFICGETADKTASSLRIDGLTNNTPYSIAIVAVDISGNFGARTSRRDDHSSGGDRSVEDLHSRGSKVEGGFA